MDAQDKRSYAPYYVGLVIALYVFFRVHQLVRSPEALERTLEFLLAFALCLGTSVLFIAVTLVVSSYTSKIKRPAPGTTELHYEANASRIKPAIDSQEAYGLVVWGVLYGIAMLGLGYQCLDALRNLGDIHFFDLFGALFGMLYAVCSWVVSFLMVLSGTATFAQKRAWMRAAAKARAVILDTRVQQVVTGFDDWEAGGSTFYEIILQVTDQPEVLDYCGRFILVRVDKRIFKRYSRNNSATIYYATQSPLVFLLQGE